MWLYQGETHLFQGTINANKNNLYTRTVYSLLFQNKQGPTIKTGGPPALAICNKKKTCLMIKFKSELCSLIPPSHLIKAPVTSYCETVYMPES